MNSVNPYIYVGLREPLRLLYRQYLYADAKDMASVALQVVCKATGIIPNELLSTSRKRELVWPRFILITYMRRELSMTLKDIGKFFNRDHSTVLYAISQYDNLYMYDREFKSFVKKINLPKYGKKRTPSKGL